MNKLLKLILYLIATSLLIIYVHRTYFTAIDIENINSYFDVIKQVQLGKKQNEIKISSYLPRLDSDVIYVTFYYKNKLRGCYGRSTNSKFGISNVLDTLYKATQRTMNDDRFLNDEKISDYTKLDTLLSFLKKDKIVKNISNDFSKEFKRGIHSLEITNGKKNALYLSYVPLQRHWSNEDLLKSICEKAEMNPDCYKDDKSRIILYTTTTYLKDKKATISEFKKYNNYERNLLNLNEAREMLKSSVNWLSINKRENGFVYGYKITTKPIEVKNDFNYIRQLITLRAYEKACIFFDKKCLEKEKDFFEKVNKYYYEKSIISEDQIELTENNKHNPALNSSYILFLAESVIDNKDLLVTKLANNLLQKINTDGSIKNINHSDKTSLYIYTGEVYLALINAYKVTNNLKYLKQFERGIPYLLNLSKNKSNIYIHWLSQALYEYFLIKKEENIANAVIDLNNYLVDNYQIQNNPDKFIEGGFSIKNPGFQTGFVIESLADAYTVSKIKSDYVNEEKFKKSIHNALRFMSQLYIDESNGYYISGNKSVVGATMESTSSNFVRLDYTGHALVGLQKIIENNIF